MVDETRDEMTLERAMVVVAHADDAEFGCSGTVSYTHLRAHET